MKVRNTLIFMLVIFAVIALVMAVFPKEGIKIGENFVLHCPTFEDFLSSKENTVLFVDVDSMNADQDAREEQIERELAKVEKNLNKIKDNPEYKEQPDPKSDRQIKDNASNYDISSLSSSVQMIEFPDDTRSSLDHFFSKLSNHAEYEKIRVLHYGDSQLEGDRISSYIRYKLQGRFGGCGMGMCSPVAVYAQYSMKQDASEGWIRCAGFGKKNPAVAHKKYGPMMAFNRFAPIHDSTWVRPDEPYRAWLKFYKASGYSNTQKFKNVYIYYGNCTEELNITVKSGGAVLSEERMPMSEGLNVYAYKSPEYLSDITFEFESFDSPDFYCVSFEDDKGVCVDNIAMRGCSGEVFCNTDRSLLSSSYAKLGADLFILQFGANAVPNTKTEEAATYFVNLYMSQVRNIRAMCPNASILVIGPNDMATKVKDHYETYPMIETIVSKLREAAKRNNCAFWDIYSAMGGYNSMLSWVESDPPLAASDYTHFTPSGAKIMAQMLYNAIIVEYTNYLQRKK